MKEALKAKPAVPMAGGVNFGGAFGTLMQLVSAAYYIRHWKGEKELPKAAGLPSPPESQRG